MRTGRQDRYRPNPEDREDQSTAAATLQALWTAITMAATPEARKQLIEAQLIPRP